MLTRLKIENFKRLSEVDFELGRAVVFVGPNNCGKTTALQALALWRYGLGVWIAERGPKSKAKERTGVTLNRRDLVALPVPNARLLWRDLHVQTTVRNGAGRSSNQHVRIGITVDGVVADRSWSVALEFNYANPESLYCRPLDPLNQDALDTLNFVAERVNVAFLPPMSGLASVEPRVEPGRINVLVGEGQTAQVLRNLCLAVHGARSEPSVSWREIAGDIGRMFGVELIPPEYIAARGEVEMGYRSESGVELDISSAGRGLQQVLLLLAFLHAKPNTTLLLDEPDAHLEVLRQRQIYNLIKRVAEQTGGQIIAASHSEVVLTEAAGKDTVIAFLGNPHRLNDQGSQLRKALLSIGYEHYLQAEENGWVLYLEGSTDLAILQALARRLNHPVSAVLERPYVDYVESNTLPTARDRFYGIREAKPDLVGLAIFDRLDGQRLLQSDPGSLTEMCWRRKEIESYVCTREALISWAEHIEGPDDLVNRSIADHRREMMKQTIEELEESLRRLREPSPWSGDLKVSDRFLDPLFENYLERAGLPREMMRKKSYYELAEHIPLAQIDPEITEKLEAILEISRRAKPRRV